MLLVIAEAAAQELDIPRWAQTIAQLGIGGLALWYLAAKVIPALVAQNKENLSAFREESAEHRKHCSEEASAQRQHDAERTQEIHLRLDRLADKIH